MGDKIWRFLYNMHLYDSKGEGLFKASLITFSWVGGVNMITFPKEISVSIATSLFLFSVALIMEYAVRLVTTDEVATRLLPFIVVIVSVICALATFGVLVDRPSRIELKCLYNMTIFPQILIWFDVMVQLMIGKPVDKKIESSLKEVEVG